MGNVNILIIEPFPQQNNHIKALKGIHISKGIRVFEGVDQLGSSLKEIGETK